MTSKHLLRVDTIIIEIAISIIIVSTRWPRGRADVSEPGGPGFDSSSRQPKGRRSSALNMLN